MVTVMWKMSDKYVSCTTCDMLQQIDQVQLKNESDGSRHQPDRANDLEEQVDCSDHIPDPNPRLEQPAEEDQSREKSQASHVTPNDQEIQNVDREATQDVHWSDQ